MPLARITVIVIWVFTPFLNASPVFSQQTSPPSSHAVEVYVWGKQPTSAATEQTIRAKDFELRPSSTPSDILRMAPGLVIAQHAGGGKADQIFLRGFDADHGTDVAIFVDGIPVNMVSHAHGQGYADLHWLIPEIVDRVEVYKGPYFVQFGDIATAGAVNIITKRRDKDSSFTITGGAFDTQRYLTVLSPPEGTPVTPYIAFEGYHNNGRFDNPNNLNRYNLFTKFTILSSPTSNLSFLGTLFKSYWMPQGRSPRARSEPDASDGLARWIAAKEEKRNGRISTLSIIIPMPNNPSTLRPGPPGTDSISFPTLPFL